MYPPKLISLIASSATVSFDPTCLWVEWDMCGAGGGGAGTDTASFIDHSKYGQRGSDSYFFMMPGIQAMCACAPGAATFYISGNVQFDADEVIYFENIPAGVSLQPSTPYWVMPVAYNATTNVTTINVCTYPLSPPQFQQWGKPYWQTPLVVLPIGGNPVVTIRRFYFGAKGGGGGGLIGDQGCPLGYWGHNRNGPDGVIQAQGWQGGCGGASFRMGGMGGVNSFGGNSCNVYQTPGNAGNNNCGAGGAGGAPAPGNDWGGCGGAAGSVMRGKFLNPGVPIFCVAGNGGLHGAGSGTGYDGGDGGNGLINFWMYF